jgi:phospholipid transport system substrate-binding protein
MNAICRLLVVLSLALAAPAVVAGETAPDALLAAVTSDVTAAIKESREGPDGAAKLADLVEAKVLPLFNFPRMAQLAMGRNWRLASAEQQTLLTIEFRRLLVRTYSAALAAYRDQTIEFKRLRAAPGDTEVTVKSDVSNGTERTSLDYEVEKTPFGWQVFDVKIDGVSLVTAYRGSFASKVRADGVEGLIRALTEKNRQGSLEPKPANSAENRARLLNGLVRSALRHGG